MQVRLFACCESFAFDAPTNRVSLFHVMEEINSPAFPTVVPTMAVIASLVRDQAEPEIPNGKIRITLNNQEPPLIDGPYNIHFQGRLRNNSFVFIQGLVVFAPGTLRVALKVDDVELAAWEIPVNQVQPPHVAQAGHPAAAEPAH